MPYTKMVDWIWTGIAMVNTKSVNLDHYWNSVYQNDKPGNYCNCIYHYQNGEPGKSLQLYIPNKWTWTVTTMVYQNRESRQILQWYIPKLWTWTVIVTWHISKWWIWTVIAMQWYINKLWTWTFHLNDIYQNSEPEQ
jgi:hypothetical protein